MMTTSKSRNVINESYAKFRYMNCFHNFLYSRKYDLIRLTPYDQQRCISQFCDITKGKILQKFPQPEKRDYQVAALSSLQPNLKMWLLLLQYL